MAAETRALQCHFVKWCVYHISCIHIAIYRFSNNDLLIHKPHKQLQHYLVLPCTSTCNFPHLEIVQ